LCSCLKLFMSFGTARALFYCSNSLHMDCLYFGKFACKCNIQQFCFALPVTLVTPVFIVILVPLCSQIASYPWMWILWALSQFWITFYIWTHKNRRLAATDQIFGTDYYNALLLDQSMMFNRRSDDGKKSRKFDFKVKHFSEIYLLDRLGLFSYNTLIEHS
jgi:hypothetical protein